MRRRTNLILRLIESSPELSLDLPFDLERQAGCIGEGDRLHTVLSIVRASSEIDLERSV